MGEEAETAVLREVAEEVGVKTATVPGPEGKQHYYFHDKEVDLRSLMLFESAFFREEQKLIRYGCKLRTSAIDRQ